MGSDGELGRAAGGLWAAASLARRVLDECHDAAGHEPRGSDTFAGARHLNHFDNAPARRDFDPAARAGGNNLVGARTVVPSYDDLDAVALHPVSVLRQLFALLTKAPAQPAATRTGRAVCPRQ